MNGIDQVNAMAQLAGGPGLQPTPPDTTPRRRIGASAVAAVLGLSPFRTPLEVYLEITEAYERPQPRPRRLEVGKEFEASVARLYSTFTGNKVRRHRRKLQHEKYPWLAGYIDRLVLHRRRPLEVKIVDTFSRDQWGEDGTDEIPDWVKSQVAAYQVLGGYEIADVAALIGASDFRIFEVPKDEEFCEFMIDATHDFWHNFVLPRIAPPPSQLSDIRLLYGRDNGRVLTASPQLLEQLRDFKRLKGEIKARERQKAELEFAIKAAAGEAATIADPHGYPVATWRQNKPSTVLDAAKLKAEEPDIWQRYAVEKPGARPLLTK